MCACMCVFLCVHACVCACACVRVRGGVRACVWRQHLQRGGAGAEAEDGRPRQMARSARAGKRNRSISPLGPPVGLCTWFCVYVCMHGFVYMCAYVCVHESVYMYLCMCMYI